MMILINMKLMLLNNFVNNNEISGYFNNADIIILPYIEASQSGVLPIAQHCCIPWIVTDVGG